MKKVTINGNDFQIQYPPWADIAYIAYQRVLSKHAQDENVDADKAGREIREKTKKLLQITFFPNVPEEDWDLAMVELTRYIHETWGKVGTESILFRAEQIRKFSQGTEPSPTDTSSQVNP